MGIRLRLKESLFSLVENIKDAFDVTIFNQRFSSVDQIWLCRGDWSNERSVYVAFTKTTEQRKKIEKSVAYRIIF